MEDVAVATVRFANGALGVIEATHGRLPRLSEAHRASRLGGSAVMEEEDLVNWDFASRKPHATPTIREKMANRKSGGGGAADPEAIGHHGHARQFQDVVHAIRKGGAPAIDGPEGRRSVEIILAIYKAAETGRAVTLPLTSDPTLTARKTRMGK